MRPQLRSPEAIEGMRIAGRLAARCLEMIAPEVRPGISTETLDRLCHDYIVEELNAIPACLGYKGFPKSICTSVNSVVCHGIPNAKQVLKQGDIINIDVTVLKNGWHGDTSIMLPVGKVPAYAQRLIDVTRAAMIAGIKTVRAGARLGDIGAAIQAHAHGAGYSVVREYCGHGISTVFHEDPQIRHYGSAGTGMLMRPGMCFTIEPMINQGRAAVRLLADNWTVKTADRKMSAQWEHTLMVTEEGAEIFTLRTGETL